MKNITWISLAAMMALTLGAAEPDGKTVVKGAAKKLADKDNYSWASTWKQESGDQNFQMTTEGKTEKAGCTFLALTFGDRSSEVAIKGGKVAVKVEEEWKAADELEGRGAFMARRYQNFKAPAGEAEDLADKAKALKSGADGLFSGDLTELGAKELLSRNRRGGGQAPEPKEAKGSVKFWVKDGALTKYEFNLQGKVAMGQDQDEREVNRTTTVEIKDVGTTKVTVPEEAKKKLS
jgi:hypothetical protein